ncbi:glycosyltransferase family 2 protein [Sulfurovum sp. TSL1]|uniref:glycosyltransferase family 2 protein n=1 Tax=Sulfurovum sp. TSL1 TaxID=2826994 RepID=UPI001CC643BD|nr:glycosyltransferase family 2 protein [Sulfurovum sp. TSL1]GIT98129.1 glycosyl transferase [Sulfurovum sp. TSL1]
MIDRANVSVVIPCYNAEKTIVRALDSIVNQTLLPLEVVIVDDKSMDNSCDIIKSYAKEQEKNVPIKLIELDKNAGPAKARNVGWDNAKGEYIAFLDADDSWHPQKLELQYNYMSEHPDVVLSGHLYEVVDANNVLIESKKIDEIEKITKSKLLFSNRFSTPTVMLKRGFLSRFREFKKYSEDYLLWLEIVLNGNDAILLKSKLTYLFKAEYGVSGLSGNMFNMYKGGLVNYKILLNEKLIGFFLYVILVIYRSLKFLRMLIVSKIRT